MSKHNDVYGLNMAEMKFKHTLWIDPSGKVYDVSSTKQSHHVWAKINKKKFSSNETSTFAMAASSKWVKVRNHINVDVDGMKDAIRKHAKLIMEIVDGRMFTKGNGSFRLTIQELDENGSVEKFIEFKLPKDDGKLRRYL